MSVRRSFAALLEFRAPVPLWRGVPFWGSPVRRLALPPSVAVVGVGGATLGGSGRTPVAIAVASALAGRGLRVAFVGHGYGGRFGRRAVEVVRGAVPEEVGDEALLAFEALEGRARVFVGSRERALSEAARHAEVLVVDRLLQTTPRRLACAVLAVDAAAPWGSGRVFPLGDLVAPSSSLAALADEVARVGSADARSVVSLPIAPSTGSRVGLVTSLARPERVRDSLLGVGAVPVLHVKRSDHAPLSAREASSLRRLAASHSLSGWWVDPKTRVWLARSHLEGEIGAPALPLSHHVVLAPPVLDRIEARIRSSIRAR